MMILRLYPKLPPLKGGMEQHLRELTLEQQKLGHKTVIWFNRGEKVLPGDQQILPGIPLTKIRPQALAFLLFHLAVCFRLLRKPERPDWIHIHGDWSSFLLAGWIKRLTGAKKVFFSIHGAIDHYRGLRKKLLLHSLKNADKVFCSGFSAQTFLPGNIPSVFRPSGIKPLFFNEPDKEKHTTFTLVTVSNLVRVKRPERLIELAERLPAVRFVLVGTGPMKSCLETAIRKKKLHNLELRGFLSPSGVFTELQQAHAFLLTSEKEGTPTALLEAMAAGLPLIVSGVGGIQQLLGPMQQRELIKDPQNPDEWMEKIRTLQSSEKTRLALSAENRTIAREFSWENVALHLTNQMFNA
jgi:glycosyltransferase involved in cell wall biosynthesis